MRVMQNRQKDNISKEQKFYKTLQDVFIGAQIEGEGGFVNLMKIKSNYYRKIEDTLKNDIENALQAYPDPEFRNELFDKLYTFFSRYFSESGSIYFNSTPFHNNIYEKVYTDEKTSFCSGRHRCFTMLKLTEYSEAWMWMQVVSNSSLTHPR